MLCRIYCIYNDKDDNIYIGKTKKKFNKAFL